MNASISFLKYRSQMSVNFLCSNFELSVDVHAKFASFPIANCDFSWSFV